MAGPSTRGNVERFIWNLIPPTEQRVEQRVEQSETKVDGGGAKPSSQYSFFSSSSSPSSSSPPSSSSSPSPPSSSSHVTVVVIPAEDGHRRLWQGNEQRLRMLRRRGMTYRTHTLPRSHPHLLPWLISVCHVLAAETHRAEKVMGGIRRYSVYTILYTFIAVCTYMHPLYMYIPHIYTSKHL